MLELPSSLDEVICSPDLYPKLVARTATLTSLVEIFCVQTIPRDFGFLNDVLNVLLNYPYIAIVM